MKNIYVKKLSKKENEVLLELYKHDKSKSVKELMVFFIFLSQ